MKKNLFISGTAPELGESFGKPAIILSYDRYDHWSTRAIPLPQEGEKYTIVTYRVTWGPDGSVSPRSIWEVWRKRGEIKIERVGEADTGIYDEARASDRW